MGYRPYHSGAPIFDLGQLEALSPSPDNALIVSDRTLYLIQNLTATIIQNRRYYATDFNASGYHYLQADEGDDYDLYVDVYRAAWLETIPVKTYAILETITVSEDMEMAAGSNILTIHTVPAGELHEVNIVAAQVDGTIPSTVQWALFDGEMVFQPWIDAGLSAAGLSFAHTVRLPLSQGWSVVVLTLGATEGDVLTGWIQYSVLDT